MYVSFKNSLGDVHRHRPDEFVQFFLFRVLRYSLESRSILHLEHPSPKIRPLGFQNKQLDASLVCSFMAWSRSPLDIQPDKDQMMAKVFSLALQVTECGRDCAGRYFVKAIFGAEKARMCTHVMKNDPHADLIRPFALRTSLNWVEL